MRAQCQVSNWETDKVIRRAPCPVLAFRHPEHELVIPDDLDAVAHVTHG
jgi:hypothetical protein